MIELDGHAHADQVQHDETRTAWLEQQGYRVIRFLNWDTRNVDGVLMEIARVAEGVGKVDPSP